MSDADLAKPSSSDGDGSDDDLLLNRSRPTKIRWLIFALACMTSWFLYMHRYTWNFIRPLLKEEYDFSNTQLESLYTLFGITYGIGQVPSGVVCDFFGPHMFLGIIIALWSLLLMVFGSASSLAGFGGMRLVFGATQAGAYPSLAKVTRLWFPVKTRTIAQSFIASFFGRSGGAMSSIIMGTVLIGYFGLGWRTALIVMGAVGLVFAALFLWLYRNEPETDRRVNKAEVKLIREGEVPTKNERSVLPVRSALKNRSLAVMTVHQMLNAGADGIYTFLMGSYFIETGNFSMAAAGLLVSLPLWGGAIGGIAGGFVNDGLAHITGNRRRSRAIAGFSGKFVACLMMFVAIAQTNGIAAAWVLFLVKFFSDWSQPTVWGACTDLGGRFSATVFSIVNTAGSIGGIVTALLIGFVNDMNTTIVIVEEVEKSVTNYTPAFTIVAVMYLGSALCWFFINTDNRLDNEDV